MNLNSVKGLADMISGGGGASGSDSVLIGSLNDYFVGASVGPMDTAISDSLRAYNILQKPGAIPINKDQYGYVFFTRPQLNMTDDNLRNIRVLTNLLNEDPRSLQRYTRCMLDPRLALGYPDPQNKVTCPFIVPATPFIPLLTNTIKSCSGWPDVSLDSFTSKQGVYKEDWSIVDGPIDDYGSKDLQCTFRNIRGDPHMLLFMTWMYYMAKVFEGTLYPYTDYIVDNRIDYQTRVYRLVMDEQKRYVTKIGATGVTYPQSWPAGSYFDFNSDKPFNDQNDDITISFKGTGIIYHDPILVHEFNKVSVIFGLADWRDPGTRSKNYRKVPFEVIGYYQDLFHRPYINPVTMELEWWMTQGAFNQRTQALKDIGLF